MTTMFTFRPSAPRAWPSLRWPITLAALLITVAAPVVACEKSLSKWIAGAENQPQSVATFTGEFVNGAPVYRLPAVIVVARRDAEIARTQRDDAPTHAARPPASAAPAVSTPKRKVASAAQEIVTVKPCVG